ncbi:hypothetical protein ACP275_02G170200 [Erythranthe tilingii]
MNVDRSKWSWADNLWLIMPPLPGKSIRCALRSSFRNGLPESSDVAFILSGTLKGLDHMHRVKNAVHPNSSTVNASSGSLPVRFRTAPAVTYASRGLLR